MFAAVTTALDGEISGVRRPVPALLEFVRLPVGSEQVLARVTLETSHVMHPHLAVVGGVMVVVCYTGHNDRAVLVNDRGTILDTGLVVSAGDAVAIRPSPVAPAAVEVAIALAGGTHYCIATADARLDRVDIGAPAPIPVPEGLTSGGIHDWTDSILWTDAVPLGALTSNRFQTVAGQPLVYPVTRGPWTLGQDGAPRVERVVGFDGAVWRLVYDGLTQHKPGLAVRSDGSCVAAIPVGPGLFIESRDFTALPLRDDEPLVSIPSIPTTRHPITVYTFGGPGFNMVGQPAHDDPTAPVNGAFYTAPPRDASPEDRATFAVGLAAQRARARTYRVPLWTYYDGPGFPADDKYNIYPQDTAGLTVGAAVFAYPIPFVSLEARVGEVRKSVERARGAGYAGDHIAPVIALYRQRFPAGPPHFGLPNWSAADVVAHAVAMVALADELELRQLFLFHMNRGNGHDGIASRADFQDLYQRILTACLGRRPWPPSPLPTPRPVPVPAPVSRFPRARSFSHA